MGDNMWVFLGNLALAVSLAAPIALGAWAIIQLFDGDYDV